MTENEEKLQEIIKDEEFILKFLQQKTMKDAQKMLMDKGINCSDEEMEAIKSGLQSIKELANTQLEEVSGGGVKRVAGGVVGGTVGAGMGLLATPVTAQVGALIGIGVGSIFRKKVKGRDFEVLKDAMIGGLLGASAGVLAAGVAGAWHGQDEAGRYE